MIGSFGMFLLLAIPFILYLASIFSTTPFLQHEILGQAFWWNHPTESGVSLFFDSERMDCFKGRFRYVEYLIQALYWKLTGRGWLPRDLYDYFAIVLVVSVGWGMLVYCRRRGASLMSQFLLVMFFLLSSQSFLLGVFHFRKAKILVGLYFLMLALVNEKWGTVWSRWSAFFIGTVGFLTDPFCIVFSPIIAAGLDWQASRWRFPLLKWLGMGSIVGAVATLFLANVVGPYFHPNSTLTLALQGIPVNFFRFSNLPQFPRIAIDIMFPLFQDSRGIAGVVVLVVLCGLVNNRLFLVWVLCLPVAAFIMEPSYERGFFAGYYGFPLLVLLCIALVVALGNRNKVRALPLQVTLFLAILCHQMGKQSVYSRWVRIYTSSEMVAQKVETDRRELVRMDKHFKLSAEPYSMILDKRENPMMHLSSGSYSDQEGKWERTDIAYLLIPMLFQREIKEGKLVLLEKTYTREKLPLAGSPAG